MMGLVILLLYLLALLFIFIFSLGQLHLAWYYRKSNGRHKAVGTPENWPAVTVQLPVYNEKYVASRLIDCIAALDYPTECLEIQVLDDSQDETSGIIAERAASWRQQGVDIVHIQRDDRKGFKAGALQYGFERAKGEFIAVFDADFLPQADFLKKTIPFFDKKTGVVQTRWGHINRDYSILTRLQAFGLDAHFTVEQTGRSNAGSFINFNGTAGVWRKECITDAGGWSADTLTEDLDLSYRAQLKGWRFQYLEDCISPAELPVIMPAVKSQQYRWNKGAAETARKNLSRVLRSQFPLKTKLHAFLHLLNSSVFIALLIAGVLSVPLLYLRTGHPEWNLLFSLGGIFLIGFLSIGYFYWTASQSVRKDHSLTYFLKNFPVFLIASMGLSLHNGFAVLEGLAGRKTPFLRTPKFGIRRPGENWKTNTYISSRLSLNTIAEGLLAVYFIFGVVSGIRLGYAGSVIFHAMLAAGFAFVFYESIRAIFTPQGISAE